EYANYLSWRDMSPEQYRLIYGEEPPIEDALCEKCSREGAQIQLAESVSVSESLLARFDRMIGEDKATNKFGKNGFLVVFEGIDGSGKTTQVKRLADWLNDKDYSYITTRWNS